MPRGRVSVSRLSVQQLLGGGARIQCHVGFAADQRHTDCTVDQDQPLTREARRAPAVAAGFGHVLIALLAHEAQQPFLMLACDDANRIIRRGDLARRIEKRTTVEIV
jgi:hypothetical protein